MDGIDSARFACPTNSTHIVRDDLNICPVVSRRCARRAQAFTLFEAVAKEPRRDACRTRNFLRYSARRRPTKELDSAANASAEQFLLSRSNPAGQGRKSFRIVNVVPSHVVPG